MTRIKLKPEFKSRLLEALRSGRYQQTTGVLRRGDKFCCLGVMCDLVDPNGWDPRASDRSKWEFDGSYTDLPPRVISEIFDLAKSLFQYHAATLVPLNKEVGPLNSKSGTLSGCNDSGMSFEQIADIIEEQF